VGRVAEGEEVGGEAGLIRRGDVHKWFLWLKDGGLRLAAHQAQNAVVGVVGISTVNTAVQAQIMASSLAVSQLQLELLP